MRSLEDIRSKILKLTYSLKHILPSMIDCIINVSSTHSPSSSFLNIQTYARIRHPDISPIELLGVSKLTRWLAVIRRDFGYEKYRETIDMVNNIISRNR